MGEEEKKNEDESEHTYKKVDASKGRPSLGWDQLLEKWRREQVPVILRGLDIIQKHPKLYEKDWIEEILDFSKRAKELQEKRDKIPEKELETETQKIQSEIIENQRRIIEKLTTVIENTEDIKSGKMSWRHWLVLIVGMIGSGIVGLGIGKFFP